MGKLVFRMGLRGYPPSSVVAPRNMPLPVSVHPDIVAYQTRREIGYTARESNDAEQFVDSYDYAEPPLMDINGGFPFLENNVDFRDSTVGALSTDSVPSEIRMRDFFSADDE